MGEAEGEAWGQKGYTRLQEIYRPQADEYSHAEEIVGDDEGALGGEEKVDSIVQGMNVSIRGPLYSPLPFLPVLVHTGHSPTERAISNVFPARRTTREWRHQ